MFLRRITTTGLAANCYVIADLTTKQAAVIDPTCDVEPIISLLHNEGFTLSTILETHVHADFISGAKELKFQMGGKAVICCSGLGGPEWVPVYANRVMVDRESIELGGVLLQAWHTPGHTPEHIIWVVYDQQRSKGIPCSAFTGDLLFVGSIGRPDLLGASAVQRLAHELYHSLFVTMADLPDYVEIFPSHGAGSSCGKAIDARATSTMGYERLANRFLKQQPEEEWISSLLQELHPAPGYFTMIKKLNVQGISLQSELPFPAQVPLEELLTEQGVESRFVCDLRSPEAFAAGHLPNSVNIPFRHAFAAWAAAVIPKGVPIVLLLEDAQLLPKAILSLHMVGIDQVSGFAIFKDEAVEAKKSHLRSFGITSPKDIAAGNYLVIDVRTAEEWNSGHIPNSLHVELSHIMSKATEIPRNRPIAVLCRSGNRASTGASVLRRAGHTHVCNIEGGIQEWTRCKLPLEK